MENIQGEGRNPALENAILKTRVKTAKREGVTKGAMIAGIVAVLLILVGGIFVYSLFKKEKEEQLAMRDDQRVSFTKQVSERDSVINEWLITFDQIEKDLNLIKEKEKIITVRSNDIEFTNSRKERILEDIRYINTLLESNKKKIASLNAQLNSSGGTIKGLQNKVAGLETTIKQYETDITELNTKMTALEETIVKKDEEILTQTDHMNEAFLVSGTFRELKDKGIVARNGGFLGFGKSGALAIDMKDSQFAKVDVREVKSIPVNSKNAKLISKHPTESYSLIHEGKNKVASIEIKDPDNFWKFSRYAVVEIVK